MKLTPSKDIACSTEIIHDCSLGGICGGCFYCGSTYAAQLEEKNNRVAELLKNAAAPYDYEYSYEGILSSPLLFGYRNKMEYSFGDCMKNGPLTLGLHKKKSFYDVIDVDCCQLVHNDCNLVTSCAAEYFRELKLTYTDKRQHLGYLRYLIIRRAVNTGEMLIDLVTTSQPPIQVEHHMDICDPSLYDAAARAEGRVVLADDSCMADTSDGLADTEKLLESGIALNKNAAEAAAKSNASDIKSNGCKVCPLEEKEVLRGFTERLLALQESDDFKGKLKGILHTVNDALSDAVRNDGTSILYGDDHITESLLGLNFVISPFSFFQTNSKGAELLYSKVREYISDELKPDMHMFDLYSGTGTIAQMLAPCVARVTGVEIVAEAVEAAKENAARNGLHNCEFIAADVLKALDELPRPDAIILDPPRDGVNPKALRKIIDYGVENIVYVSCKPESLARDLVPLQGAGYRIIKAAAVDQFPWTKNVETVVLLSK